ncbi:MAG: hypothetical protein ACLU2J_04815 [Clostridia bacterium]
MKDKIKSKKRESQEKKKIDLNEILKDGYKRTLEEMGKVSALLMLVKKMKFLFHLNLQKMHLMETRF